MELAIPKFKPKFKPEFPRVVPTALYFFRKAFHSVRSKNVKTAKQGAKI